MSDPAGGRDEQVSLRLTWDGESSAGYPYLTDIGPGEAVTQRVVEGPQRGAEKWPWTSTRTVDS